MNKLEVTCCFCNKKVISNVTDPCDLNILCNWDKDESKQYNQTFYCHLACFKEKLDYHIRPHLVLEVLVGDNKKQS